MRKRFLVSISLVLAFPLAPVSQATANGETYSYNPQFESIELASAVNTLEHFMIAGANSDPERGAVLMAAFEVDARRTVHVTRKLFKKEEDLFSLYNSISSDIYGYEVKRGLLGTSVSLEGGIQTSNGSPAEFSAKLIYRNKRWLITQLDIE